ncbi:hypothetical protein PG989_004032 [Apiospora arundinis]|uniref:Uncharacterized protein n=1 Tax=Apiospora arundinis TaxID=335852 RepID=A0ABR2I491_9PEZI
MTNRAVLGAGYDGFICACRAFCGDGVGNGWVACGCCMQGNYYVLLLPMQPLRTFRHYILSRNRVCNKRLDPGGGDCFENASGGERMASLTSCSTQPLMAPGADGGSCAFPNACLLV